MTNSELRAIRKRLGLTQAQLARVLGYAMPITVSAMEREKNPRAIPHHVAMLMTAFDDGYRTRDWPE